MSHNFIICKLHSQRSAKTDAGVFPLFSGLWCGAAFGAGGFASGMCGAILGAFLSGWRGWCGVGGGVGGVDVVGGVGGVGCRIGWRVVLRVWLSDRGGVTGRGG